MKEAENYVAPDGVKTDILIINEEDEAVNEIEVVEQSVEETTEMTNSEIEERLNSKSLDENMDAGLKIMGIGMAAVFAVLTILYLVVKIMGHFAKGNSESK